MVRVVIESDDPISVNVNRNDGIGELLKSIEKEEENGSCVKISEECDSQ